MSDLFWLTDEQMARLQPYFPKSHGRKRVDDRRVLSGIIFVNRNGLRWRDAPREYGPAKTLYNRWKRWSDKGIFIRIPLGWVLPIHTQTALTEVLRPVQRDGGQTLASDATLFDSTRGVSESDAHLMSSSESW